MMSIVLLVFLTGCAPSLAPDQVCEDYVDTWLYESCMCLDAHQGYFNAVADGCCDEGYRMAMQAACDTEREQDSRWDSGDGIPGLPVDTGSAHEPACEWLTSCSSLSCVEPTCDPNPPSGGDK